MRRQRKDGTFPLIFRLTHKRRTTSIKIGICLQEADWDADAQAVRKSAKSVANVTRLNNEIQKKKAEALDRILQLPEKPGQVSLSVKDVKNKIQPSEILHSFYDYAESLVKDLRRAERIGTANSYHGTISMLKTFNKGKPLEKRLGGDPKKKSHLEHRGSSRKTADMSFQDINFNFLKAFETYHLSCGNGLNGLAVYMRNIRAIYNQAIKEGLADRNNYPFTHYKIRTVPTEKRALNADWLNRIVLLQLPQSDQSFNARNYFVASYMMYGMNFADMAFLKKSDILDDRIHYRRRKTSRLYDIKVSDELREILAFYINQDESSPYVFPIIKRSGAAYQHRDMQTKRKVYNENLKDIAKRCGITQNLTSYVSRHSFATQAMLSQIPLNAISAMLGHASLKTTEVYLDSFPSNILDQYNARLVGALGKPLNGPKPE